MQQQQQRLWLATTSSKNLARHHRPHNTRRSSFLGGTLATSFQGTQDARRSVSQRSTITMMPEGPEVRALVDQMQPSIGCRLADLRFLAGRYTRGERPTGWNEFRSTMTPFQGQKQKDAREYLDDDVDVILDWKCKGKFMYILLDEGRPNRAPSSNQNQDWQRSIWITLGMTGRFMSQAAFEQAPEQPVRWYMELYDKTREKDTLKIYYSDLRNFGTLKFSTSRQDLATKLQSLGPDILDSATTFADFCSIWKQQRQDRLNICKFLMDQGKISGVGNYILAEALYRASIDPYATLDEIDSTQQQELFIQLQAVAKESYDSQSSSTGDSASGFEFQCYGRDVCARGTPVLRDVNGPHGRTIWYTNQQLFRPLEERDHFLLFQNKVDTAGGEEGGERSTTALVATRTRRQRASAVLEATAGKPLSQLSPILGEIIGPNPSEKKKGSSTTNTSWYGETLLRIVSFNAVGSQVSAMAPVSWRDAGSESHLEAMQQELLLKSKATTPPDVIALQECSGPEWWSKPALGLTPHYVSLGSTKSHAGYVTLLVRKDWRATAVSLPYGFPAVAALIEVPFRVENDETNKGKETTSAVFVASMHLAPFAEGADDRRDQLQILFERGRRGDIGQKSTPLIVMGDTNMRQAEDAVAERNWRDAWKEAGAVPAQRFSWNTRRNLFYGSETTAFTARFDRLYYATGDGGEFKIEVPLFQLIADQPLTNNNHFLSDHFGLWVDLKLRTSSSTPSMGKVSDRLAKSPRIQGSSKKRKEISPELAVSDLAGGITDQSWQSALSNTLDSDWFRELALFVQSERSSGTTIYPPTNKEVFAALNACPMDQVKVVILGQDPYHGPGQAHGLAFSVPRGIKPLPPSLRNIFKELIQEGLIMNDEEEGAQNGNLQQWADQGVLLLNTVLTVRRGEANSHASRGWEQFSDEIIRALTASHEAKGQSLVFLLWGKPAAQKATNVIDTSKHVIIQTSHPSPLSANRTSMPFLGSGCFQRANQALREMGQDPIDWNVN